jgi:hypothetical protein
MQLDRTRIVIRERNVSELLDLALKVCATFPRMLVAVSSVLIVPFVALNEVLVGWMVSGETTWNTVPAYLTAMSLLVFIEAPFCTIGVTVFLGRIMFLQETDIKDMWRELRTLLGRIVWTQLVLRGVLVSIVFTFLMRESDSTFFLLWIVSLWVGIVRMVRPFMNEIVLLEKNPLWSREKTVMSVRKRSRMLHGPNSSDLLGRWIMAAPAMVTMVISLSLTIWFLLGMLSNSWSWGGFMTRGVVPIAMWCVAIYSGVFRFLSYLDLRIRREGWEIELKVRAAASELREKMEFQSAG